MLYKINSKKDLEEFIAFNWDQVNSFIDQIPGAAYTPFYCSVDIRESKNKYAPVDNNLYPAGFNNICMFDLNVCVEVFKKTIEQKYPGTKNIAIIPESNTKNLHYLDHLYTLAETLKSSDYQVLFISPDKELFNGNQSIDLLSHNQKSLHLYQCSIIEKKFSTMGKTFDLIILNNDQSNPLNVDWQQVITPITPSPLMGWYHRQKVNHFMHYHEVCQLFCEHFSINPDLIQAKFKAVSDIDFNQKSGFEKLAQEVDLLLEELPTDSSVFVKASQGTYGMGISVVKSGAEILSMNRKTRNKMDIGKNKIKFNTVLVQEGIETIIKYDEGPAEVTIYLINGVSVGGFMRANPLKDSNANLNSRGMIYQKFCISEIREASDHKMKEATYSVIARLSCLAAAREIEETLKEQI